MMRALVCVCECLVELHVFGNDAGVSTGIEAIADRNVVELTS